MPPAIDSTALERYAWEHGRYVLYVGVVRVLATERVAVLLDVRLGALVTHGDALSVRCELEEMQRVSITAGLARYGADWLLLEGCPQIEDLNRVIRCPEDFAVHQEAFRSPERRVGLRLARQLLARIALRR